MFFNIHIQNNHLDQIKYPRYKESKEYACAIHKIRQSDLLNTSFVTIELLVYKYALLHNASF